MIKELLAIGLAGYLSGCAYVQDRQVKNFNLDGHVFATRIHNEGNDPSDFSERDYCFLYADGNNDGTYLEGTDLPLNEKGTERAKYKLEKFPCDTKHY